MSKLKKLMVLYDTNFYFKTGLIYLLSFYILFVGFISIDTNYSWALKLGLSVQSWKLIRVDIMSNYVMLLLQCGIGFVLIRMAMEKNILYAFLFCVYPFIFISLIVGAGSNLLVLASGILYLILEVIQHFWLRRQIAEILWHELELVPGVFLPNYETKLPRLAKIQKNFIQSKAESTLQEYRIKFNDSSGIRKYLSVSTYDRIVELDDLFFPDTRIYLDSKSKKLGFTYQELYLMFSKKGGKRSGKN